MTALFDEKIIALIRSEKFSLYRISGKYAEHLKRYIVSAPESREILNHPEIAGCRFTDALETVITRLLMYFPEPDVLDGVADLDCNVLNFLRGGLNFGIANALDRALGFNLVSSSFMTSQRDKDDDGLWFIKDDQYQKFTFPRDATIFCADIVATGSTVENGFHRLFNIARNLGKPIKNVIFFTIGCHKAEKILEKYHILFKNTFKRYSSTFIFYIEGKFRLADLKSDLRIKIQGTDLLRHPALLAPEFEYSQYQAPFAPLERCVIYDGGTRKFQVEAYFDDVSEYWLTLRKLARTGFTLGEAYRERWVAPDDYLTLSDFHNYKKSAWEKVDEHFIKNLYDFMHSVYRSRIKPKLNSREALEKLCMKRLEALTPKPSTFIAGKPE